MRYWADITGISLDESTNESWIQALPLGTYRHPLYGNIVIDEPKAMEFANNVNANVRGTQLDIDYDHKKLTTEASGWIKQAKVEPGKGLFVLVEWTQEAAQKIKNRAFKYFSPEFVDKWTHPKTNMTHNNVLLGGALTNRPFLKDIMPINLSEILDETEGDASMDSKLKAALIKRFGLKEDATDEQVMAALESDPQPFDLTKATAVKQDDGTYKITADGATGEVIVAPEPVKANESNSLDEQIKSLSETNPALAQYLTEQRAAAEATAQRLADVEKANKLSEVNSSLANLPKLPPVVTEMLKPILVGASTKLSEDVLAVVTKLHEVGLVDTTQKSGGRQLNEGGDSTGGGDDAVTKFLSEVDNVMNATEGLSYIDAVTKVRETQPQLYAEYDNAVESAEVN